ncbi:hypothetical protein BC826DRAFT_1107873 [Russula brevipes]|nr:hypothetical protein BC826DRAFT_1107873 [Russula brevipes]
MHHTTSVIAVNDSDQSLKFDRLSFLKYMKNIGGAYRKQAIELISICRDFVQAQGQTPESLADPILRDVVQLADDALQSTTGAGKKTSKEVDEKFAEAIDELSFYESVFRPRQPKTVAETMEAAKSKDKTSLITLDTLKEKLWKEPTPEGWSEPTKVVDFVLCNALPDDKPTVVQQVLGKRSSLAAEVLWNFSRCKDEKKRLTLKQNPHFYAALPKRKEAYGGEFRREPIEQFTNQSKIYVLIDRPGRIYIHTDQYTRAFGNFWVVNEAIIFKNVCGKLEGESIVGVSIQGIPNLQYRAEPSSAAPPTNPDAWKTLRDWREPIHRIVNSPDISIHIGVPQFKPLRSTWNLPSTSSHAPPRSPNPEKRVRFGGAISAAHTQTSPTVKMEIHSNDEAPQSASPYQHLQSQPTVQYVPLPQESQPLQDREWTESDSSSPQVEGEGDGWQPGDLKGVPHSVYTLFDKTTLQVTEDTPTLTSETLTPPSPTETISDVTAGVSEGLDINRHWQNRWQSNYLSTRQDRASVPSPNCYLPDTDDDVSMIANDEEYDNFSERFVDADCGDDNGPNSLKTASGILLLVFAHRYLN